jgi:hypothetical protein
MHSNFNDLKTTKMEAKEWFEKSEYQYALDEYDEGGYLGIDENKVAQMLEEYHQDKLKLLGIGDVVGQSKQLCECKCEYPIIRTGVTEYCSICQLEVK